MACELKKDDKSTFPGHTYYSTDGHACAGRHTAVYLPPNHNFESKTLNVVLFLHGFYVSSHRQLFQGDRTKLREQVLAAGKDVVLVAPFLGTGNMDAKGKYYGDYAFGNL